MLRTSRAKTLSRCFAVFFAGWLLTTVLFAHAEEVSAAGRNKPSSWAKEEIEKARTLGLIPYSLMGNYQEAITRAEMCQIIVRLYERLTGQETIAPNSNPFKDTKDESVLKAYALGIVKGTSADTFSPDKPVTREQIAVMLFNTLVKAGFGDQLPEGATPESWTRPRLPAMRKPLSTIWPRRAFCKERNPRRGCCFARRETLRASKCSCWLIALQTSMRR